MPNLSSPSMPTESPQRLSISAALPSLEPSFIEVKEFDFFYGKKQALFDINLDIPARQVTAFIGPSGCGKSTLLRNFNRMNELIPNVSHEGDIMIDGTSIFRSIWDTGRFRRFEWSTCVQHSSPIKSSCIHFRMVTLI